MYGYPYQVYEWMHMALAPARAVSDATSLVFKNPLNPLRNTYLGRNLAASAELFERMTRRYGKPSFGLETTTVEGEEVAVTENVVWERPFCKLIHFERATTRLRRPQPKLLIVAPMSGHYATLLRGTVEQFLKTHDVYITDWADARMVPLGDGSFDLDDYIDYLITICHKLSREHDGVPLHTLGVCQPSVPLICAMARMEADGDPNVPASMTLMGGPIDTRVNPNSVNDLAERRGLNWFRNHVITKVPFPHPGLMRDVYPGFLQLHGFMSMNLDRHIEAHQNLFLNLVKGDGDSAQKHREFYDEYLAVMDLAAEFYLQTVDTVFIRHALPKGEMMHRDRRVDPAAIKRVALMTVEGENDDISSVGQTEAAHALCVNIPAEDKVHYMQPAVGHYGVFNGSRFRAEIAPRIADFVLSRNGGRVARSAPLKVVARN